MASTGALNGNGALARRWERYFLALLFAVVSALSTWAWGMQAQVSALQREVDRRSQSMIHIEEMRKGAETRAIQLAVVGHDLRVIKGRLDTMTRRILSLAEHLDRARSQPAAALPTPEETE